MCWVPTHLLIHTIALYDGVLLSTVQWMDIHAWFHNYFECATNNTKSIKSTKSFGVPSRVHSDKGGENYDMLFHGVMYRGGGVVTLLDLLVGGD